MSFPDPWKRKPLAVDEISCSCGIGNAKPSQFPTEEPLSFSAPTRHSKSLDQLQMCPRNNFHYSLSNIRGQAAACDSRRSEAHRTQKLKNVASEHNMSSRRYDNRPKESRCSCERKSLYLELDTVTEKRFKQFNIKNLTNVKQQYNTLVKSLSQTPSEGGQNIFRSNSVQFFSPKKRAANGIDKFNSRKNGEKKKHNKQFEIGSTSSSTESVSFIGQTGSKLEGVVSRSSVRRVRSASCLVDDFFPSVLSGTESLPNINSKLEERLYPEMRYFSSSSSSTSEQSGWITSRSSSIGKNTT